MVGHITKLSQVCFFHLRRIRVVRHSLTRDAPLTLVHAFVCSQLNFCNSAMYGINSYLLDRLQSILNAAGRLLLRIPKFSSISSSIRDELHWLPVRSRIFLKHCLLVRSWIAGSDPSYLAELCVTVSSVAAWDVKVCARPPKVPSWYLGSGQNGTVDGVFLCQDHTSGTYCRQEFALSLRSLFSSRENLKIIQCSNTHIALLRSFH